MQQRRRVAISGGSSPLAQATARLFAELGWSVVRISESDFSQSNVSVLAHKISGCYAVCNISRVPLVARWTTRSQFTIYSSRMSTLRAFGAAIALCDEKPKVFVCASNAMLYDQYEVHDDFSSELGQSFFTEVALMETRCTLDIAKSAPQMRLVIARMGFVMCKGSGPFPILKSLSQIRMGGIVGDGYQCLPMVHVSDAARSIAHLVYNEESVGIYNVTLPEIASMEELVKAFGKSQFTVPHFLIHILAGRASAVLEQNCKVVPNRIMAEGFRFEFATVQQLIKNLLSEK